MANRVYLVGSNQADSAGPNDEGINYNPDTEILAGASYHIPIFWLSLFEESDIKTHVIQEYRISAPVRETATSRNLLHQRQSKILATFSNCEAHWKAWLQLINETPYSFLKFDATEIWDLDPELYEAQLPFAIRWFSSGSDSDFEKLLSIAEISVIQPGGSVNRLSGHKPSGYDTAAKTLTITDNGSGRLDSAGHHLHGYKWVRDVPWQDE